MAGVGIRSEIQPDDAKLIHIQAEITTCALHPETNLLADEDGDVIVRRRVLPRRQRFILSSESETVLDTVGQQLWRASLLMCDAILDWHSRLHGFWEGKLVLELGAGLSLPSLLVATVGATAVATDMELVLPSLQSVLTDNPHLHGADLSFAPLDWSHLSKDVAVAHKKNFDIIIGCDLVYDDRITDLLFAALEHYCAQNTVAYITIDKRFNFEIESMKVVAHGYEHFLDSFCVHSGHWSEVEGAPAHSCSFVLCGRLIDTSALPTYTTILNSASPQPGRECMELWELRRIRPVPLQDVEKDV